LAIVGSVVIEFSSVTRSVLARHPKGVVEAARAELAKTRTPRVAAKRDASRQAFRYLSKPLDSIARPPNLRTRER
jgi:hypothetical protein